MTRATVFGYGDIGVRCLATLLAHDVRVPLVVTHEDDRAETQWFGSLAQFAQERDIAVVKVESIDAAQLLNEVSHGDPDFIFSFYYRRMLPPALLALARRGALNMHGSLLPKFRGRAPINWAILQGETETGATLHYMTEKADAGAIVAQHSVPILADDTALDVFRKVCSVAELMLHSTLPSLLNGTATATEQNLAQGNYFGARRPEDGTIDWSQPAQRIHDLVRAVAPPFPGARTMLGDRPSRILRTLCAPEIVSDHAQPTAFTYRGRCYVTCGDRKALRLLDVEIDGRRIDNDSLARQLADSPIRLPLRASS